MKGLLLVLVVFATVSACQRSTAKFQVGDEVVVKVYRQVRGFVCLRTHFFTHDVYYLKVPGSFQLFHTIHVREIDKAARIRYGAPEDKPWHYEGPFEDTELELTR